MNFRRQGTRFRAGRYSSAPAVCNDRTQFFLYKGKHVFVKAAGWLQPPT